MKIIALSAIVLLHQYCAVVAFVPATGVVAVRPHNLLTVRAGKGGSSAELGLPCEAECALESFPNLPPSVHPGVLSGQAQIDLLMHAKENGECWFVFVTTPALTSQSLVEKYFFLRTLSESCWRLPGIAGRI